MLRLTVTTPGDLTEAVTGILYDCEAVSVVSIARGAALRPEGDVLTANVAREAADDVLEALCELGVHERGCVEVESVTTWISRPGYEADVRTPGSSADAVVWPEVAHRSYEDTELNWTFLSFMTLATLLAAVAIVTDSQILTIGAMVLGPEFGAIAALGLALVRRRPLLLVAAVRALVVGFVGAIVVTTLFGLAIRGLGWATVKGLTGPRPGTDFIYSPNKWSFIVAVLAAAAGVLSVTSGRTGGLNGVFISVTTIPAAGNLALGAAFGQWGEVLGSGMQLLINVVGMGLAGWGTLALQRALWSRVPVPRSRLARHLHLRSPGSPGSPGLRRR